MANLTFNVPMGTGVTATEDADAVYLRLDKKTVPWKSNGPKGNMLFASTGGFQNFSGYRVNCTGMAPKH